jgi:hypothetical protein
VYDCKSGFAYYHLERLDLGELHSPVVLNTLSFEELRIDEDPNSDSYLGTFIQNGSYNNDDGDYNRAGNTDNFLLYRGTTFARQWDFDWFNEYSKFYIHFEAQKDKVSETTVSPSSIEGSAKTQCHGQ